MRLSGGAESEITGILLQKLNTRYFFCKGGIMDDLFTVFRYNYIKSVGQRGIPQCQRKNKPIIFR